MACKHNFVLINKTPYERVKHCTKCHIELGEHEKEKATKDKEEKPDAE